MTLTVRDVTFNLLRACRMSTIFGNPGSTELPMYRNFPEDFRYVLALQECVALGMADGYAQATRNAAFVNLHSAAGLGHAMGNLFTAYRNQTPLVVTAGQQARSILPYEPFLYAERASEFPHPYVKWSCEPARAQDVPAAIARAYYTAMQPPFGPTFVSIPIDDWDQPCDPLEFRQIGSYQSADPKMLMQIAEDLARAQRPVIVVGAGVARDEAYHDVVALAERHSARVWVAPLSGRNSFPEDHRLFAGFLSASREAIVSDLAGADLVLVLGGPLSTYHVEGFGPHIPVNARQIQIVNDPSAAAWAPIGTSIVTNIAAGVRALLAGPPPVARTCPTPRAAPPKLAEGAFTDAHLLARLGALRPKNCIIVEEAPSARGPLHDYVPMTAADSYYTAASGGLGFGLPAAVGVALGRPQEKVIALIGDGSSMYAIQGLWSAAQLELPISFVIIKNRRYEALRQFGRLFQLDRLVGTELPDLDFCALAKGHGVPATNVRDLAGLDAALLASFSAAGPTLVEVEVE